LRAFADDDDANCLLPSGARSHLVTLVPATTKQHPLGATFSPALLTHQSLTNFSLLQSPLFLLCWPAGALRPGDRLPDPWAPFLRRRSPFSCGGGGARAGLYTNTHQQGRSSVSCEFGNARPRPGGSQYVRPARLSAERITTRRAPQLIPTPKPHPHPRSTHPTSAFRHPGWSDPPRPPDISDRSTPNPPHASVASPRLIRPTPTARLAPSPVNPRPVSTAHENRPRR